MMAFVMLLCSLCGLACLYMVVMTYDPLNKMYNMAASMGRQRSEAKKKKDAGEDFMMETPKTRMKSEPPSTGRTLLYSGDRVAKVWRGGRRRSVRPRSCRVIFNLSAAGDCAFEAMLMCAGLKRSLKMRTCLRKRVAESVQDAVTNNECILGVSPTPYIEQMNMTGEKYAEAFRAGLWASKLEVACMVKQLKTPVKLSLHKGHMEALGECKTSTPTLMLRDGHYILVKMRLHPGVLRQGIPRGGVRATASRSRSRSPTRPIRTVSSTLSFNEEENMHEWPEDYDLQPMGQDMDPDEMDPEDEEEDAGRLSALGLD